jgi:hypothetical protein
MTLDEFEALRLADMEGLHQDKAAARMGISRQTFGRIVENARRKVARVLHSGMALSIEGGTVRTTARRCPGCGRNGHPNKRCRRTASRDDKRGCHPVPASLTNRSEGVEP